MNRQTKRAILAALITAGALPIGARLVSDFPKPAIIGVAKPGLILPKKNSLIPNLASLPLMGAGLGVDGSASPFDLSFLSVQFSASDLSTYTFSTVGFGAADADRKIAFAFFVPKGDPPVTVTSVTIGGVTASFVTNTDASATAATGFIYEAAVPTGTTGDIVVTLSGGPAIRCIGGVWRIISGTSSSGQKNASSSASGLAVTVTIPSGGVGIYASYNAASSSYAAWNNLDAEDFDQVVETTRAAAGGRRTTAGATSVQANASAVGGMAIVGCAYGP